VGNARLRERRGGIRPWRSVKKDIVNHLREDRECIATTMVDYYGMPQTWPGRERASTLRTAEERAECVQHAIRDDVVAEMGGSFNYERLVPFVVMHEFEGLLFSDCAALSRGIGRLDLQPSRNSGCLSDARGHKRLTGYSALKASEGTRARLREAFAWHPCRVRNRPTPHSR
jgi:hypothetical protein